MKRQYDYRMSYKSSYYFIFAKITSIINMKAASGSRQAKTVEHWRISEDMHYHFFLVLHYQRFAEAKAKIQNIFKDMEGFLGKESTKCRSHHQKRMKGHSSVADMLRDFYYNFYQIRCLDIDHCAKEFECFLKEKQQRQQGQPSSGHDGLISQFAANLKLILQDPLKNQQIVVQSQSTHSPSQKQDSKQLQMHRIETNQTLNRHCLQQQQQEDHEDDWQEISQRND